MSVCTIPHNRKKVNYKWENVPFAPTGLIDPAYHGRIWKGNGHIAIDCGAVFDGRLGCLRLEDMREFYV